MLTNSLTYSDLVTGSTEQRRGDDLVRYRLQVTSEKETRTFVPVYHPPRHRGAPSVPGQQRQRRHRPQDAVR